MSNSSKGASSLASVIQRRMAQVAKSGADIGVTVEFGEIVQGDKLKLYSVPGAILDRSDYSVCECVTIRNEYYEVKPIVTAEEKQPAAMANVT